MTKRRRDTNDKSLRGGKKGEESQREETRGWGGGGKEGLRGKWRERS